MELVKEDDLLAKRRVHGIDGYGKVISSSKFRGYGSLLMRS